ncbi:hypothetical protein ACLOJK_001653 [Asimina triloba]
MWCLWGGDRLVTHRANRLQWKQQEAMRSWGSVGHVGDEAACFIPTPPTWPAVSPLIHDARCPAARLSPPSSARQPACNPLEPSLVCRDSPRTRSPLDPWPRPRRLPSSKLGLKPTAGWGLIKKVLGSPPLSPCIILVALDGLDRPLETHRMVGCVAHSDATVAATEDDDDPGRRPPQSPPAAAAPLPSSPPIDHRPPSAPDGSHGCRLYEDGGAPF